MITLFKVFGFLLFVIPWLIAAVFTWWTALLILREILRRPVTKRTIVEAHGRYETLSQGRTYLRDFGPKDGPPIVLVHGLTTPSFVFDALIPDLVGQGHRVITYDHFGRGLSDRPRGRQTGGFFSDHLQDVLRACGIDAQVKLVGYSMGGAIITDFAARFPDKVSSLVLIAPAGMQADLGGTLRAATRLPLVGDWLMHAFFPGIHMRGTEAERHLTIAVPGLIERQQEELYYRGFIRSVLSSLRGILQHKLDTEHRALAQRGLPVTAIWGEKDDVIPLTSRDVLSRWNGDVHHVVVEGAGHGLTYTHPDEVLDAMES